MRRKYVLLVLLCLQGLLSCREEKKEPDLTLPLVGDYEGGMIYGQWYGWGALQHPPEARPCNAQFYKVDNNTVGIDIKLSDRVVTLHADVLAENQVLRLVVEPAHLPDRHVAGIAEPDQPGYHGTFDPATKGLKLNLQETREAMDFLARVSIRKQ